MNNIEHKVDIIIRMLNLLLIDKYGQEFKLPAITDLNSCPVCKEEVRYTTDLAGKLNRICACTNGLQSVNIDSYGTINNKNR